MKTALSFIPIVPTPMQSWAVAIEKKRWSVLCGDALVCIGFINITLISIGHVNIFIRWRNGYHVLHQRRPQVFILFEHLMMWPLLCRPNLCTGRFWLQNHPHLQSLRTS